MSDRTGTLWKRDGDICFKNGFHNWININHLSKFEMKFVTNVLTSRHISVEVEVPRPTHIYY